MSETDFLLDLFELASGGGGRPARGESRCHEQMAQTAKLAELGLNFVELIHELRQPMAGIFGFAQLLAEKPNHASAAEWAGEIVEQSLRMQEMIERLRRFSRLHQVARLDWIDPRAAIDEAVSLLPRLPPGMALDVDLPPALPKVHADHHALVQIFWNLLNNARDAMAPGPDASLEDLEDWEGGGIRPLGEIRIEWSAEPGLRLRVLDQGSGIPDEVRASIFAPFVTSKGARGTGLGLYICQSLAAAQGAALKLVDVQKPFTTAFELCFDEARAD